MKAQFASMLQEGSSVDSVFALRAKEVRSARTGDAYLSMELADRTGRLPGVMFRPSPEDCAIPAGSVVRVRGTVTKWRGVKRVSVSSVRATDGYSPEDMMSAGRRHRSELMRELKRLVATVESPGPRAILRAVFGDGRFVSRFLASPASQSYHHACIGGLAEHTLAVAGMCARLVDEYEHVDRDMLVAGALLHDVGKAQELSVGATVEYTDAGLLLGHVILGERYVREAVARSGSQVQEEILLRISHLILSHHGELEWGAPKRPVTLEALILHHADNLDAKVRGFIDAAGAATLADGRWTDSYNLFRRPLWAPRALEDDRHAPPFEPTCAAG